MSTRAGIVLFMLLAVIIASCGIKKRVYRPGFYFAHKHVAVANDTSIQSRSHIQKSVTVLRPVHKCDSLTHSENKSLINRAVVPVHPVENHEVKQTIRYSDNGIHAPIQQRKNKIWSALHPTFVYNQTMHWIGVVLLVIGFFSLCFSLSGIWSASTATFMGIFGFIAAIVSLVLLVMASSISSSA